MRHIPLLFLLLVGTACVSACVHPGPDESAASSGTESREAAAFGSGEHVAPNDLTPGPEEVPTNVTWDPIASRRTGGDSCRSWQLESGRVESAKLLDVTAIHPRRTARILVETKQCLSDLRAPMEYAPALGGESLTVWPRVWRSEPGCEPSERVTRLLNVRFPHAGNWTIVTEREVLRVEVVEAPVAGSGTDAECVFDFDCGPRAKCLSGHGDTGPANACGTPCEVDLDCNGQGTCLRSGDGRSHVCSGEGETCAEFERPCPDGFECDAGRCAPMFRLKSSTRHACTCDADCGFGLRCAWHAGAGRGRCEALCRTHSRNWCQGPHVCQGSIERVDNVCGWIGD